MSSIVNETAFGYSYPLTGMSKMTRYVPLVDLRRRLRTDVTHSTVMLEKLQTLPGHIPNSIFHWFILLTKF